MAAQGTDGKASEWRRKRKLYRQTHPGSFILFAVCIFAIMVVGWQTETSSCIRGQSVRAALNYQAQINHATAVRLLNRSKVDKGKLREEDLRGYRQNLEAAKLLHVHQLDCSTGFWHLPDTH